jgi:hypothetical protein
LLRGSGSPGVRKKRRISLLSCRTGRVPIEGTEDSANRIPGEQAMKGIEEYALRKYTSPRTYRLESNYLLSQGPFVRTHGLLVSLIVPAVVIPPTLKIPASSQRAETRVPPPDRMRKSLGVPARA